MVDELRARTGYNPRQRHGTGVVAERSHLGHPSDVDVPDS